ncbi:MAG TPA: APC family permease [Thermoanaerobaculia bacterium]|nr:APC family permease [Thermoanaerobaculia bacterium]
MSFKTKLLGRRLASWQAEEAKIGVWRGVPALGLDGLASASYGPEAALTILIPLGLAGLAVIEPITIVILAVLALLYFSYRQTIAAYPNGGGSYVVAKQNLGTRAGLLAGAALMLDYLLNVAVGISAGVGALISAVPALHEHQLSLCLAILAFITLLNLRGVRETGGAFAVPTYLFVATLAAVLAIGVARTIAAGGHPQPVIAPPRVAAHGAMAAASLWILLRAFASGCTAMTGVEAVSNGVPLFREPRDRRARQTLTVIVVILGSLLAGIAFLARAYGVMAMDQTKPGYQSILSLLVAAVVGRNWFYYLTLGSVLAVLCLSANTSFTGFPRLCRMIAEDDYLPHALANVGRRLVYSSGIIVLAVFSGVLLVVFDGITDRLIPLFAVGAFAAFTLSQAGMVMHWRREGTGRHWHSLLLNGAGAVATAVALAIIIVAKFHEGAWITVLVIPLILALFGVVKRHYAFVAQQVGIREPLSMEAKRAAPLVVIPIRAWDQLAEKALRFAMSVSSDVIAVHVAVDDAAEKALRADWQRYVDGPVREAGLAAPRLIVLPSPYRRLFAPLLQYVDELRKEREEMIAVLLPDLVEGRWWEHLLHSHRADVLRSLLLMRGNQRVAVISVPWYLERRHAAAVRRSDADPRTRATDSPAPAPPRTPAGSEDLPQWR